MEFAGTARTRTDDAWPPPGARSFLLDGAARRGRRNCAHYTANRFRRFGHARTLWTARLGARARRFQFPRRNPGRKFAWLFSAWRNRRVRNKAFVRPSRMAHRNDRRFSGRFHYIFHFYVRSRAADAGWRMVARVDLYFGERGGRNAGDRTWYAFGRPDLGGTMEHERFEGERTLMRIHIGESDRWHGKPLYDAIVELLRAEKFSGATVLRGVGGFGSSSVYHTDKIMRLSQDLPIVIEVIENAERIEKMLPELDQMIGGGLVTLEKVRVILYRSNK